MSDPLPSTRPPELLSDISQNNPGFNARGSAGDFAAQELAAAYLRLYGKNRLFSGGGYAPTALDIFTVGGGFPSGRLYVSPANEASLALVVGTKTFTAGEATARLNSQPSESGPGVYMSSGGSLLGVLNEVDILMVSDTTLTNQVEGVAMKTTNVLISFEPYNDNTTTLGSASKQWKDIYVKGNIVQNGANLTVPAAATQAEQEAGSSTTAFTTPGRQQFHPSAAKCWGKFTGNSTTIEASYNITSVADTALGQMTVTIATDFSGIDWVAMLTAEISGTDGKCAQIDTAPAAGTVVLGLVEPVLDNRVDPVAWHFAAYGDQA